LSIYNKYTAEEATKAEDRRARTALGRKALATLARLLSAKQQTRGRNHLINLFTSVVYGCLLCFAGIIFSLLLQFRQ
jgi:hypothetical protein